MFNPTSLHIHRYGLPIGVVGKCFLDIIIALMTGIMELIWNYERLVVLPIMILQLKKVVDSEK